MPGPKGTPKSLFPAVIGSGFLAVGQRGAAVEVTSHGSASRSKAASRATSLAERATGPASAVTSGSSTIWSGERDMTGVAVVIEPPLVYTAIIHEQKRLIKCGGSLFRLLCLVDASPSAHRLRRRLPRLGVDVPRHPVRRRDASPAHHGRGEVRS